MTTKYLLCRRYKFQHNRRKKNLTDADFYYTHVGEFHHLNFDRDGWNHNLFDSVEEAHQEIQATPDSYEYGHRIYQITRLEDVKTDVPYQPQKDEQPA